MKVNDRETGKGRASQRSSAAAAEHYDVGYRKPPRQHQFKKGQSGNKRGRRKGTQNMLGVFKKIADEKVKVRIAGESRVMTLAQYVILANYYAARSKNQNAIDNILKFGEEIGQFVNLGNATQAGTPIAASEALTPEKFEALFGMPLPTENTIKAPQPKG